MPWRAIVFWQRKDAHLALTERRIAPSEQIKAVTDVNAVLRADNARLERANADLKAANRSVEQKLKSLQVAVAILLAVSGGLGVGLATGMAGATAQTAFSSAAGVFFGVVMASMAILVFVHR
jgi:hypothetical protein